MNPKSGCRQADTCFAKHNDAALSLHCNNLMKNSYLENWMLSWVVALNPNVASSEQVVT